jgi:hypothetical protein
VDCTVQKEVCERYDVRGYPLLLVLNGKYKYEYNGVREIEKIYDFVESGFKLEDKIEKPAKGNSLYNFKFIVLIIMVSVIVFSCAFFIIMFYIMGSDEKEEDEPKEIDPTDLTNKIEKNDDKEKND